MALQTDNLAMIGLGVLNDTPPDTVQPRLVDGIHLRWSFLRELGFPWYGFFLFRRRHRQGRPICLGDVLLKMKPGPWSSNTFSTPYGQFTSDTNLVFTDEFPETGASELDLRSRQHLLFTLDPQRLAYNVEASIGFRKAGQPDGRRHCVDFRRRGGFIGPNPLLLDGVRFLALSETGQPLAQTRVVQSANDAGLDCSFNLEVTLPCASHSVELTISQFFGPGKVRALDEGGAVISSRSMPDALRGPQSLKLEGKGIVRVVISAPSDAMALHEICYVCDESSTGGATSSVKVEVLAGNVVVAQALVQGLPGEVVRTTLAASSISAVSVSGGDAALVDLCFQPVALDANVGWELVPDFKAPLCLPAMHPLYPCGPQPTNAAISEGVALGRVLYGPTTPWTGAPFAELHGQLVQLIEDGPAGPPMASKSALVAGTSVPPDPDVGPPKMVQQYPLDLVLLASLNPAVSQMVGLSWVDQQVRPAEAFDYLVVADHTGVGKNDPARVLDEIRTTGFVNLDGYILFDMRIQPAAPVSPPADVRSYALPAGTFAALDGSLDDATNSAGLRWDLELLAPGVIKPYAALMYLVWRDKRGDADTPSVPGSPEIITLDAVLVARSTLAPGVTPVRPPDWPPFPLHYVDSGLPDGWYGYTVTGIDIFGRHSLRSADARWFQWSPEPQPRAWYYKNPPADSVVHPSAIRLLDKTGPPSPQAVEAFALDPTDPMLQRDASYDSWFAALSAAEQANLVGVRVRWRWTMAHARQAPDTREFRIYVQPDSLNAFAGTIIAVTPSSASESAVETELANTRGADAYTGCWLRVGANAFKVIGSGASTPLTLRVKNIGATNAVSPAVGAVCTLTIPQVYNTGHVSVLRGSAVVTGAGTLWTSNLVGMSFKVVGEFAVYRVATVNSPTEIMLDHPYAEADGSARPYGIRFPLYEDFKLSVTWQERFFVVPFDQHVTVTVDDAGQSLRMYEVFIPVLGDTVRTGLQLPTSLAVPVRYAHIGVSAADNKPHTADAAKWAAGNWGGPQRFGNEGTVSAPAKIFVVRRTPPPAPSVPPDSDRVFASRADYHSRSFYTYRWVPSVGVKTHVFRTLDDTLFQTDWQRRAQDHSDIDPADVQLFPSEWNAAKRAQVAAELNHLNAFAHDADRSAAVNFYRSLSNDGLRALAALPGNERAFTQLTIQPLDPADPATANRLGPDDAVGTSLDPGLRAYIDTLDGRASNRNFYRCAYVDGAHNRGPLGMASPPVWLPDVVPPRTPVITKVVGGDRQITLRWASNREPDLAEYRIYRTQSEAEARDTRLMTLVKTLPVSAADRMAPPSQVTWTDETVAGLTTYYYRLAAADASGNVSIPSQFLAGRAFDDARPDPPAWDPSDVDAATGAVTLHWSSAVGDLATFVQRSAAGGEEWQGLSGWLARGLYTFVDDDRGPGDVYGYRLRVMDANGRLNNSFNVETA